MYLHTFEYWGRNVCFFKYQSFKTQLKFRPANLLAPNFLEDHKNSHGSKKNVRGMFYWTKFTYLCYSGISMYKVSWNCRPTPNFGPFILDNLGPIICHVNSEASTETWKYQFGRKDVELGLETSVYKRSTHSSQNTEKSKDLKIFEKKWQPKRNCTPIYPYALFE